MKQNLNRLGIRSHDDDLADTTVQRLGGLVGSFLGLLVVGRLLDEIEEGDRKIGIGQRECLLGHVALVVLMGGIYRGWWLLEGRCLGGGERLSVAEEK